MRRTVTMNAAIAVTATAIDAEAFAPFGDLIVQPPNGQRSDWTNALANSRSKARISLETSGVKRIDLPATLAVMERHAHSFQTFIPLDVSRYLICVAPNGSDDLPAIAGLRAFIIGAGAGITYRANVWHHPIAALDRDGQFAILMWRSGGDDDEEFVDLNHPVNVRSP